MGEIAERNNKGDTSFFHPTKDDDEEMS